MSVRKSGNAPASERGIVTAGTVRLGPLLSLPAVLTGFGVDAAALLAEFGLTTDTFADPESVLSFRTLGRLLRRSAEATGCDHVGLLIGQRATLSSLGALGFLMNSSPTVGDALRALVGHVHVQDRGANVSLQREGELAALRYEIFVADLEAIDQLYLIAALVANNALRAMCGSGWAASEVRLPLRKPRYAPALRQAFGAPLRFEADQLALVITASVLDRPLASADPLLHQMMAERIRELEAVVRLGVAERARRLFRTMVLLEDRTPGAVACRLGMSLRTLNRRLAEDGTSARELRDQACREAACQLLTNTDRTAGEIAHVLGYADASAFTRAFRRWTGAAPGQWRATRAGKLPPGAGTPDA